MVSFPVLRRVPWRPSVVSSLTDHVRDTAGSGDAVGGEGSSVMEVQVGREPPERSSEGSAGADAFLWSDSEASGDVPISHGDVAIRHASCVGCVADATTGVLSPGVMGWRLGSQIRRVWTYWAYC